MMKANQKDSVLIEQVVYLASRARRATGQDPIFDIPKGLKGSTNSCPIARALNLDCSVSSTSITFRDKTVAKQVSESLGLPLSGWTAVSIPTGHPFGRFVSRFDSGNEKRLRALRI